MSNIVRIIIAVVVGVLVLSLVGVIVVGLFRRVIRSFVPASSPTAPPDSTSVAPTSPQATQTITPGLAPSDSIATFSQFQGPTVVVPEVNLSQPGWLAIHLTDSTGQLLEVLTNSPYLYSGTTKDIKLYLPGNIPSGTKMKAVLHRDDGDQIFEYPGPDMPLIQNGQTVASEFTYTPEITPTN